MEKINNLYEKIDLTDKILSFAFKLGVVVGGAVLLFYCWKIGYFPQDLSAGDGLLFILLALAFGGVYLFFVVCLTSLGLSLRPVWHGLQKLFFLLLKGYERVSGKTANYKPFTIENGGFELFIFATFGLFFIWGFSFSDIKVLSTLVFCVFGLALFWSIYQQDLREIDFLEGRDILTDEESKRLKRLSEFQPFLLGVILAAPLFIGGVSGKLLDGAMRLANVRADAAAVHLKEPYVKYAAEFGVKGLQSNFGGDYSKFENTSILFNGFGKNIVIEIKGKDGRAKLVVPSDHVYIVQR